MGGVNYIPEPDEIYIGPEDVVYKSFTLITHTSIYINLQLLFIVVPTMTVSKVIIKIKQAGISGPYDILLASQIIDLNSIPDACNDGVNNWKIVGTDIRLNHKNPSFTLIISTERYDSTNDFQFLALGIYDFLFKTYDDFWPANQATFNCDVSCNPNECSNESLNNCLSCLNKDRVIFNNQCVCPDTLLVKPMTERCRECDT